ncbi:MAG: nitroreductase [Alphaproteobacteria bacterium]|nr:MAG: nitroreductase [Alphaproteobacteria bacterium]
MPDRTGRNAEQPLNLASPEGLAALLSRRSVKTKDLDEPGPGPEDLERILAAARRVPDHGKLAPWRFLVFRGTARDALGRLIGECYRREEAQPDATVAKGLEGFALQAPVLVVLVSTPSDARPIPEWEQRLSAGAAGFALLAATHMTGYAGQWLTGWPAYSHELARTLGLGREDRIAGFFFLGTPKRKPSERPRPTREQVVREFTTAEEVSAARGRMLP